MTSEENDLKNKKLLKQAFHGPKNTPNRRVLSSTVKPGSFWIIIIFSPLSLTAVFLRQFNPLWARGTLISTCKKFKQVPQLYRGSPLSFLPFFFCLNQVSMLMEFPIESHRPCLLTDSVLTHLKLKNNVIFVDDLLTFSLRNCEKFRCTTHSRIIETLGT